MGISYKRLWKLLIDKDMTKMDLRQATGVSTATIARMSKSESVSLEVLMKICKVLGCNVGDIVDVVNNDNDEVERVDHKIAIKLTNA